MRVHTVPLLPVVLLTVFCRPAAAETVVEAWRSPFGIPRSVSVNTGDGSLWAATGCSVMHLASDGTILGQTSGFCSPASVSVNPTDGSCWVADTYNNQVAHLSADGAARWRGGQFGRPESVAASSADGSCWVADTDHNQVVHLSEGGVELWRGGGFSQPESISANTTDGSCWVADTGNSQVVHLSASGQQVWRGGTFAQPWSVSVNGADGSCWVADNGKWDDATLRYVGTAIVHLSSGGAELWRGAGFDGPLTVSADSNDGSCWVGELTTAVHLSATGTTLGQASGFSEVSSISSNPADGSCWVADFFNSQLVHLSTAGAALWGGWWFDNPFSVSLNTADGSCWVAEYGRDQVVHLSGAGAVLWVGTDLFAAISVSVNPVDGSCWVAQHAYGHVTHLAADGTQLWQGGAVGSSQFATPQCVSVNTSDGSCWVSNLGRWTGSTYANSAVVHLSADGTELWRGTAFLEPYSVSVNPTDGSCWVADTQHDQVAHLSAAGVELWRGGAFSGPSGVSANPVDGSCWVADDGNGEVVHLSPAGVELWRGGAFSEPWAVAVNPTDGSCWVTDYGRWDYTTFTYFGGSAVVHLSSAGEELWRGNGFSSQATGASVSPADGSCWVADAGSGQIVHLVVLGDVFTDINHYYWAYSEIDACEKGGIVKGYPDGLYHPADSVTRDQMAVYISRALAGGDAYVPTGPATATFDDVPTTHWAYKCIEYCYGHGVVQGYSATTYAPDVIVDRAQMAAYTARAVAGGDANVPDGPATATFNDVPTDYWAYKYVEYCKAQGIVQGYDPVTYAPDVSVTRDQMAVYVQRAFQLAM